MVGLVRRIATDGLEFVAQSGEGRLQRDELLRGGVEPGERAGFARSEVARGVLGLLLFRVRLGHAVHDDADEEIQNNHRAEDNEGDEVERDLERRGVFERAVEEIAPVVEHDDAEQRQQGRRQRGKIRVTHATEQMHARHGVDVEEQREQEADVTHRGQTF